MSRISLDEALTLLGQTDPTFYEEVRRRLAHVKDRFFAAPSQPRIGDGLHTAPPYLSDPELRAVAAELAEFALQRGLWAARNWLI